MHHVVDGCHISLDAVAVAYPVLLGESMLKPIKQVWWLGIQTWWGRGSKFSHPISCPEIVDSLGTYMGTLLLNQIGAPPSCGCRSCLTSTGPQCLLSGGRSHKGLGRKSQATSGVTCNACQSFSI